MFPAGFNPKDPNSQFINHEMQDALSWLNETNYWYFFASAQELLDEEDIPRIKKSATYIARNILISLGLGVALNVQMKRVPKLNFLNWNRYLRWICRVPLLITPYFAIFHRISGKDYENLYKFHVKYYKRIQGFQRTGDMRYLDPQGKMLQRI